MPQFEGQIKMGVFDVFQIPYSLFEREHKDLIYKAAQGPLPAHVYAEACRRFLKTAVGQLNKVVRFSFCNRQR